MAAEFVVFPTLLYVTQQGGSDNPCTLMKMSQESATSTPVCKMVIQRCLRQSERCGGWNCRTLNPLTRDRTGDEMKTLSPSPQYLSHYEQNTSAHKKSPQKRNAAQLSLSGIFLTGYWVLVIRTSRGYRLWDLRGGSTKRRMFFLMAASLAGMAPGVCDPELHSHSSTM